MSTTTTITAENVITLFPEVDPSLASSHRTPARDNDLDGYDEEQIRLMEEVCIVLDENDNPIGSASKKVCRLTRFPHRGPSSIYIFLRAAFSRCPFTTNHPPTCPGHLMKNIDAGLLHRAFSVFLFDSSNRLLLQQRATEKITFPDMWTNTCCSHPLGVPGETGNKLPSSIAGVRRAAQRKLLHELGIKPEQVPLEKFEFLTRLHYKAPSDGKWGEHEIDYVMFIQADVDLEINENEVRDVRYVSEEELKEMFEQTKLRFTPWFKLICQSMLFEWWDKLRKGGMDVFKGKGETEIRRM